MALLDGRLNRLSEVEMPLNHRRCSLNEVFQLGILGLVRCRRGYFQNRLMYLHFTVNVGLVEVFPFRC